jgi:hypothetical protein
MLTEYIEHALSKANFEKLEDGTYCGTIPPCVGIIAFGVTLYECQKELRSLSRLRRRLRKTLRKAILIIVDSVLPPR